MHHDTHARGPDRTSSRLEKAAGEDSSDSKQDRGCSGYSVLYLTPSLAEQKASTMERPQDMEGIHIWHAQGPPMWWPCGSSEDSYQCKEGRRRLQQLTPSVGPPFSCTRTQTWPPQCARAGSPETTACSAGVKCLMGAPRKASTTADKGQLSEGLRSVG
jgi:hypothetical protein